MQHANDTNRKDRAQKAARRQKFKGNNREVTPTSDDPIKVEFSHLSEDEIANERARIRREFAERRRNISIVLGCIFTALVITIVWVFGYIEG